MDRKRQYSGNVSNFQVTINNPSSSDSDSDPDYAPRRGRQVYKRRRTDSCTTGSTTSGPSESDSTGSRHSVASVITVPPTSGPSESDSTGSRHSVASVITVPLGLLASLLFCHSLCSDLH